MDNNSLRFWISVVVLAVVLTFLVTKLIWVLSVRRLEHKLEKKLDEDELKAQFTRARILAIVTSLIFSWLFNIQLGKILGYG